MTERQQRAFAWVAPLVVLGGGALWWRQRPLPVAVVTPRYQAVGESIAATGTVRGDRETGVGAMTGGVVTRILAREGQRVQAGQPIARLDDAVLLTQMRRAEQAVQTARAQLVQASRPALASDIARQRAENERNISVAVAELHSARQKLLEMERGPRLEEVEQARAQVRQEQARRNQAESEARRMDYLFAQGAVAEREAERARTDVEVSNRATEAAEANLRRLEQGNRAEDIAQARAAVASAEAQLRGARRAGDAALQSLLALPRPEEVRVARERVGDAEQDLGIARRQLAQAVVVAPFAGTVTAILTEEGGVTSPGQPVLRLVRTTQPEISVDLEEQYLERLHPGLRAAVTADAYPASRLNAVITRIGASVDPERGAVEVRLRPEAAPAWLRPDLTVSVEILLSRAERRLVVPLSAVTHAQGHAFVYVVGADRRVTQRTIVPGRAGTESVPIVSGLQEGESVVVAPPVELRSGQRVRLSRMEGE